MVDRWVRPGLVLTAALAACADSAVGPGVGEVVDLVQPWVESTPATVGMDGTVLDHAVDDASRIPRFRSLLVARHGRLVLERYFGGAGPTTLHDVRSVTKSVVSTLAGIAAANGFLPNLDTSIGTYLDADYLLDAGDRQITLRHLLTMTSGYEWNEISDDDYGRWIVTPNHVQFLLDRPRAASPGATFTYNSAAVHALGVCLEAATGIRLADFARRYLFDVIGIGLAPWEGLDRGTVNGGAGLDLQARDLLRLGQLFLQRGRSGDRQVVPAEWVDRATAPYFSWRSSFGAQRQITYGYLWWVTDASTGEAFFAWGYGGQFIYVVPAEDLVVVATTDWRGVSGDVGANALEAAVLEIILTGVLAAVR